jgi:hypothetical protein
MHAGAAPQVHQRAGAPLRDATEMPRKSSNPNVSAALQPIRAATVRAMLSSDGGGRSGRSPTRSFACSLQCNNGFGIRRLQCCTGQLEKLCTYAPVVHAGVPGPSSSHLSAAFRAPPHTHTRSALCTDPIKHTPGGIHLLPGLGLSPPSPAAGSAPGPRPLARPAPSYPAGLGPASTPLNSDVAHSRPSAHCRTKHRSAQRRRHHCDSLAACCTPQLPAHPPRAGLRCAGLRAGPASSCSTLCTSPRRKAPKLVPTPTAGGKRPTLCTPHAQAVLHKKVMYSLHVQRGSQWPSQQANGLCAQVPSQRSSNRAGGGSTFRQERLPCNAAREQPANNMQQRDRQIMATPC